VDYDRIGHRAERRPGFDAQRLHAMQLACRAAAPTLWLSRNQSGYAHRQGDTMSHFPAHTIESAPAQSKPVLEQLQQVFGLIPHIAAKMAASPVLINGFIGLFKRVHSSSGIQLQANS
jgi:hypothetical protein